MRFKLLVVKETRAGEKRVSLVPNEIAILVKAGHQVSVEHDAGIEAGFTDQQYEQAGASIRFLENETIEAYQRFFADINLIVRAKRPNRNREILENKSIQANTIMIGGLDPLERHSSHVNEYHQAHIIAYSIDQLSLQPNDPMNILAAMSKLAGHLAFNDAIAMFGKKEIKKIVLIGYGVVGQAAFATACNQHLAQRVIVALSQPSWQKQLIEKGAKVLILNRHDELITQQHILKEILLDANIVITSARRANQSAPLLIPLDTLNVMQAGSVVVDMALSEGGNVEGSQHDATLRLGNDVIVTNTSGYPKALPREASELWSLASLHFILKLSQHQPIDLKPL